MTTQIKAAVAASIADVRFSSFAGIAANRILNTDSYKLSMAQQYPTGTTHVFSYIEARKGGVVPYALFFGLQYILKEYFAKLITAEEVAVAKEVARAHGEPFNEVGWMHIVQKLGGRLPIRIRAVAEGTVVPEGNVLATVENTDPACWWLTTHLETMLMRLWYPTTVATASFSARRLIKGALTRTSGDVSSLDWRLHDFSFRGVEALEAGAISAAAHLVSFSGTDSIGGILMARGFYGYEGYAGSIPAYEHSTVSSWLQDGELECYRNAIRQFGKPGAVFAVVMDTYDIEAAIKTHLAELKAELIASGATLVVRPDSGVPQEIAPQVIEWLGEVFGYTVNSRGYKVLNTVRVIQGDGINLLKDNTIARILEALETKGWSAENLTYGAGAGLAQKMDRDSLRFAMKCSAAMVAGVWRDVFKAPKTDVSKASKAGRLTLVAKNGEFRTVKESELASYEAFGWKELLQTVFENGELLVEHKFVDIQARARASA